MENYSLYDAKTHLSALVDRAAGGESIVITKNGAPRAQLVPLPSSGQRRVPANVLKVTWIAPDFDAADAKIEALFHGDAKA